MKNLFKTILPVLLTLFLWVSGAAADFSIDNFILQSKTRVSRTEYLYTFKADAVNSGGSAIDVQAGLVSNSPHTVVVDGSLDFGDVPAGQAVQSQDTFSIRQDRRYAFDESALTWNFNWDESIWAEPAAAGMTTNAPGWDLTVTSDITEGDSYYFVKNDMAAAVISSKISTNNLSGTFQKGFVADMVNRSVNTETLDWTQFILADSMLTSWWYPDNQLALDDIQISGNTITASGSSGLNPEIQATATFEMLEDAPILKISIRLENTGSTDYSGYLMYQLDSDGSGNQNAYAPGLGWAAGFQTSGWTDNYIYDGPNEASDLPGHGIAWVMDKPVGINVPGYIFGAWFDAGLAAGEAKTITFYHITDLPSSTGEAFDTIAEWASKIPDLDDVDIETLSGTVTDADSDLPIEGTVVMAKNTLGEVVAKVATDSQGAYSMLLPSDVYTLTVSTLGYDFASRSISMPDTAPPFVMDFQLSPVTVWAGSGKKLTGSLVEGTENAIVLENKLLAMALAVDFDDSQLSGSTKGKPVDLAVAGLDDGIDWLNLPYISQTQPSGTEAWQVTTVQNDTIEVLEISETEARVKVSGSYTEVENVSVETVFTINPDDPKVLADTRITNNTDSAQVFWVGDVIDNDESGQVSYVPGTGSVTAAYANPAEYVPSEPWIAQNGSSAQCFGLIYLGEAADFVAYGNTAWIMSQREVTILPGETYSMKRYIVAVSTEGYAEKPDAVAALYNELVGVSIELDQDLSSVGVDEPVQVTLSMTNTGNETLTDCTATLNLGSGLSTSDAQTVSVESILPGATQVLAWNITGTSGGTKSFSVEVTKTDLFSTTRTGSIFVAGPGWYDGDNHSHSTYSDGSGTISQNYASAKTKGLSFVTSTDHNSVSQESDVYLNSSSDFLGLLGEEITSGDWGHCLAYNIDGLIDWKGTPQQAIDDTLASNGGTGIFYIAHPYYPGLEWDDWSVTGFTGIEVWNGFYDPTHEVNAQAFAKWDELNAAGYHVYGISNSDAHNVSKLGDPRIKAYLNEFTREEIITALGTGRFYGTNGPELEFTVNGAVMGSDLVVAPEGETLDIEIKGSHSSVITQVEIIKNGSRLALWTPDIKEFSLTVQDIGQNGDFYRLVIQTSDGGYAFSNPIWIIE